MMTFEGTSSAEIYYMTAVSYLKEYPLRLSHPQAPGICKYGSKDNVSCFAREAYFSIQSGGKYPEQENWIWSIYWD